MTPDRTETPLLMQSAFVGVGVLFALAFGTRGVQDIDPAARGVPLSARLLVLPGAAALWPLLLWKWLQRQASPLP